MTMGKNINKAYPVFQMSLKHYPFDETSTWTKIAGKTLNQVTMTLSSIAFNVRLPVSPIKETKMVALTSCLQRIPIFDSLNGL